MENFQLLNPYIALQHKPNRIREKEREKFLFLLPATKYLLYDDDWVIGKTPDKKKNNFG